MSSLKLKRIIVSLINKLKRNKGLNLYFLIFSVLLFNLAMVFLFGTEDLPRYTYVGNYLRMGLNPYTDHETFPINFYNKYPPLFFEILSGWFFMFGNSVLSLRFLLSLSNIVSSIFMYKIGKLIRSKKMGLILAFSYLFLPFTFIDIFSGEIDAISVMFSIVGIYYYLRSNIKVSFIYLSLGTFFKIYPIFITLGFAIYYIKIKEFKRLIGGIFYFIVTGIIISLPFIILSPLDFFYSMFIHASRANTGIQFNALIKFMYESISFNFYGIEFKISYNFIFQLCWLLLFTILFLREKLRVDSGGINNKGKKESNNFSHQTNNNSSNKNNKSSNKNNNRSNNNSNEEDKVNFKARADIFGIKYALLFTLSLTIIMNRGNISNWIWLSPLLLIFFSRELEKWIENKERILLYTVIIYFLLIIAGYIYTYQMPFNVFQSYEQMENVEELIQNEHLFYFKTPVIELIIVLFILGGAIFIQKGYHLWIFSIICFLNISDPFMSGIISDMNETIGLIYPWNIIFYIYLIIRDVLIIIMILEIYKDKQFNNFFIRRYLLQDKAK
ncbi:MAG: glycosyltransferase family 39 protein [Promethearchaeota archaeon]